MEHMNIPTPNVLIGRDRSSTLFVHHVEGIAILLSVEHHKAFSDLLVSEVWKTPHPSLVTTQRDILPVKGDVLAVGCVKLRRHHVDLHQGHGGICGLAGYSTYFDVILS